MRMDGKHTSMWAVWIILSVAVLAAIGVGLYFIVKHLTKCKPDCTGNKCNDGCGKSCNCANGCDINGKCAPQTTPPAVQASTWDDNLTKMKKKKQLKTLLEKSNGQIQGLNGLPNQGLKDNLTEAVLSCVLIKIISIYNTPKDFDDALNNPNMLQYLISIANDCIKANKPDPNVCSPPCKPGDKCVNNKCTDPSTVCRPKCNIGEICKENKCVPPKWTSSFYNTFRDGMISDIEKTSLPINKDIATCIIDGFKSKYSNPQKMIEEDENTIQELFTNLYTKCTKKPPHRPPPPPPRNSCNVTISDSCKSKGQNARNHNFDCGDTITSCMISAGANTSDDCLRQLDDISSYACSQMKRQKPGNPQPSDNVAYCDGCNVCKTIPHKNLPEHTEYSTGCEFLNCAANCGQSVTQLSVGIY